MFRAKDIMTKENLISVKESTPVFEAVELVVKHDISGLPVVDDDMALIGVVSEKDLLRLFPEREDYDNKTVKDFMTHRVIHFDEEESLVYIYDFLQRNIFRRVPITSNGKLVGLISVRDALKYILELRMVAMPYEPEN